MASLQPRQSSNARMPSVSPSFRQNDSGPRASTSRRHTATRDSEVAPTQTVGESFADSYEGGDEFLVDASVLKQAKNVLFNVLFFTVYGNESALIPGVIAILIEDLQIPVFYLCSRLSAAYYIPSIIGSSLETRYEDYSINTFTTFFGIAAGLVFLMALNIVFVAWGFVRGQHKYVWPINTLRVLGTFVPTVLFIPILDILTTTFQCTTISTDTTTFGGLACSSGTRIPYMVVSAVTIATFVPCTFLINLLFLDSDPAKKGPNSKAHGRGEMIYAILKTVLSFVWKIPQDYTMLLKVGIVLAVSVIMMITQVYFYPYYNPKINHLRTATYFASSVIGVVSMLTTVVAYYLGYAQGPEAYIIIIAGFVPAWIAGFVGSGWILAYIQKSTLHRLDDEMRGGSDGKPVFLIYPHVELVARTATTKLNERNRIPTFEQLEFAVRIFKHGQREFPHEPFVRLQWATYLLYLGASKMEANKHLRKCEEMHPAFDGQFQCHFMTQMNNQNREATFLGDGIHLDVASFAEFRKLDKTAKVNHQLALQWQRVLWQSVNSATVKLDELEAVASELYARSEDADAAYAQLVSRFPKSKVLLRFYAKFCLDVTNENAKASALLTRADTLEEEESPNEDQGPNDFNESDSDWNNSSNDGSNKSHRMSKDSLQLVQSSSQDTSPKPVRALPKLQEGSTNGSPANSGPTSPVVARAPKAIKIDTEHRGSISSGGSRSSNHEQKQLQYNQQLRAALLQRNVSDIRIITFAAWLIGIVSICILIASFVIITQNQLSGNGLNYLDWLHNREKNTALSYRRARQLQNAYTSNDPVKFAAIQTQYYSEMLSFQSASESLFAGADMTNDQTYLYYDTPYVPVLVSFYPSITQRQVVNRTLFQVTQGFASAGLHLASLAFSDFANITYNNQFRFIADNFWIIQPTAYDFSMNTIYFDIQDSIVSNATTLTITLTVILIVTVCLALLILDRRVQAFRNKQRQTLDVFKKVPKHSASDVIARLEEAQSEDVFGRDTLSFKARTALEMQMRNGSRAKAMMRMQYIAYGITLTALVAVSASTNLSGIYQVGQLFAIRDQFGDMATFPTRSVSLINDLVNVDTLTWGNRSNLLDALASSWYEELALGLVSTTLVYGDETRYPPSPSYDKYPPALLQYFDGHICLPTDQSVCVNQVYNSSIGFTPDTVGLGLLHLTEQLVGLIFNCASAALDGDFHPQPDLIAFMEAIFEPYYLQGLSRCEQEAMLEGNTILAASTVRNLAIFIAELAVVCIGEFFVFWRMVVHLRFMEHCIVDMIVRLPLSVRNLPDIADWISNMQGRQDRIIKANKDNDDSKDQNKTFWTRLILPFGLRKSVSEIFPKSTKSSNSKKVEIANSKQANIDKANGVKIPTIQATAEIEGDDGNIVIQTASESSLRKRQLSFNGV
ncbi:hypothetical protein SmJEL517_g03586 [Synchytrium microbalum]|uniref:TmcB/TmcC TPR repeats domain-containing protein n=1 Tax=Synchytrium microbalum TaxID=1806994 RepID=A0A507BXU3_9FUNG|nr:uncharacterized protein SmJEL517_g03586 [Synchytrium microbalum]TPX33607.1 hypothetical protein SmJEL517_g03586 [Synchytrium microbalum]